MQWDLSWSGDCQISLLVPLFKAIILGVIDLNQPEYSG